MLPATEASRARILIVDDLKSNVRLLEHTLRRAGYGEVTATLEPAEVADLHALHDFDLILLDLQMPHVDGFEVLQRLQKIKAAHPVTVLVISADASQTAAALEAGADGFLGKPFRLPDVVERVQGMLKTAN